MSNKLNIGADYSKDFLNNLYSNSKSNGLDSLSNSFGDYNSIKNGSYKKLASAYYNQQSKLNNVVVKPAEKNETSKNYKQVQAASTQLVGSTKELSRNGLYEPEFKEIKDENTGSIKVTEEINKKKINEALSSFVDSYNNTLKTFENTNNVSLLKKADYLTKFTKANERMLNKIGINIGEKNQLSIDSKKLESASVSDIKLMFNGNNSFGARVSEKANQIEGMSKNAVNRISRLYDGSGSYKATFNTDTIINNYF